MTARDIEFMYLDKELKDIKEWCIKNNKTIKYRNQDYYLYQNRIYDKDMNLIIEYAENGFLDLFEYYEYFPQNAE
jgi:hypothetical protein